MNRKLWWILGGAALLLAVLSPLASSAPDGLEKVAGENGFGSRASSAPFQLISNYLFPGIVGPLSTILAGVVGVVFIFGLVFGISRLLGRSKNS